MERQDFFEALLARARHDMLRAAVQAIISSAAMIAALVFAICNYGTEIEAREAWAPCGFVIAFLMSWFAVGGLTDIYCARETVMSVRSYREREAAGKART